MGSDDAFLSPVLSRRSLDDFLVRSSILRALCSKMGEFRGILLDVGSGDQPYRPLMVAGDSEVKVYISLDIPGSRYASPDLYWDGVSMSLKSNSVDCAMATEVIEHCPKPKAVLSEICRVLKPGGILFLTVPFLWPLHDVPDDEFRYTPFSLARILHDAGFAHIDLEAMGGWDASLAQMIGLWARRRPMSEAKRAVVSLLALPVVKWLARRDSPPTSFKTSVMITGIAALATKD